MKNVGVYIGADPLTYNDLDLITKCIQIFGFVYILLDRKNRDAAYDRYYLNYSDRSDIICHDMKKFKECFKILPIDVTVQLTLNDNNIKTLVLNLEFQRETNFEMQRAMSKVLKGINILCMSTNGFIGNRFVSTVVNSDSSMLIYKDVCSDYAYAKMKVKTMKKIGITGNMGSKMEIVADAFRDKGLNVIDLDEYTFNLYKDPAFINLILKTYESIGKSNLNEFIHQDKLSIYIDKCDILRYNLKHLDAQKLFEKILYQHIQEQIMKCIMKQFSNIIVIKFVLIYEYAMEQLFDKIITAKCSQALQLRNLTDEGYDITLINCFFELEQDIEEKAEYADYVINTEKKDQDIISSTVVLMNGKLKNVLDN